MIDIVRHDDAGDFLDRAEEWLLRDEATNGLLLGLAYKLRKEVYDYDPPLFLATIEVNGRVEGCAFRTPPHKLGCTSMPAEAVDPLVNALLDIYPSLPAVLGPEATVAAVAESWAAAKGVRATPGSRQRIHRLDGVVPFQRSVSGTMRPADVGDRQRVASWIEAFGAETGVRTRYPSDMADLLLDLNMLVLWEDDGPKSMAGFDGFTPNGVRINYVYTPANHREKGYASACVHTLSRRHLDSGRAFCMLYTDLANPVSNKIYRQIGYQPVCDVRDYVFDEPVACRSLSS